MIMKRVFFICLLLLSTACLSKLKAQYDCSHPYFSGAAPAPWAIDGKMDDWQTLFGPNSGDPVLPFGLALGQSAYYDNIDNNVEPQFDLRVLASMRDDYNVYFYFRRLGKAKGQSKIFYFLDINLNGALETGEPVICLNFKGLQKKPSLIIGKYVASLANVDDMSSCGNIIWSLPGSVNEFINSDTATLLPNEKFDAAVTEKGYGVEMAIPWRFINPSKKFAFRIALQEGSGMYSPNLFSDNAGCSNKVEIINYTEDTTLKILSSTSSVLIPGFSYRITVTMENTGPNGKFVIPANPVKINNIIRNFSPANETPFTIAVNAVTYYQYRGTFNLQPIEFRSFVLLPLPSRGSPPQEIWLPPFGTNSFTIDIGFPSDGSVKSAKIEFSPSINLPVYSSSGCSSTGEDYCCGKPINPVDFDLGLEAATKAGNNTTLNNEGSDLQNKLYIYPNPSKGFTNVVIPADLDVPEISITDYTGKLIRKINTQGQRSVRIENLKSGFYLLNVQTRDGKIQIVKKVIVQ